MSIDRPFLSKMQAAVGIVEAAKKLWSEEPVEQLLDGEAFGKLQDALTVATVAAGTPPKVQSSLSWGSVSHLRIVMMHLIGFTDLGMM